MDRLSHAQALPVFVAFEYPAPGKSRVVARVIVMNVDPPTEVSLRKPAAVSAPSVTSASLGDRELSVRVGIDWRQRTNCPLRRGRRRAHSD